MSVVRWWVVALVALVAFAFSSSCFCTSVIWIILSSSIGVTTRYLSPVAPTSSVTGVDDTSTALPVFSAPSRGTAAAATAVE